MQSSRDRYADRQGGWSVAEIHISIAIIFVLIFAFVWVILPFDRYKDSRNAVRIAECYSLVNSILLLESDSIAEYWGESEAPIDHDPQTAQIIVKTLEGATCAPGRSTTPTCPGAIRAGLRVPTEGWGCLALLDDGRYNDIGLIDDYLLDMPIDPAGPGKSRVQYIRGLPLGYNNSGYYINRTSGSRIEVGACQPEMGELIIERR